MAKAAIASGADSLMIEVHPDPAKALSDGPQSLTPKQYQILMQEMTAIAQVVGRCSDTLSISKVSSLSKTDAAANNLPNAHSFLT